MMGIMTFTTLQWLTKTYKEKYLNIMCKGSNKAKRRKNFNNAKTRYNG